MAIFLDTDQAYRLLQRELPDGVYPDGAPSAFYSTASIYAKAAVVAAAYSNLERIYLNMFPQSADENIHDWEIKAFGFYLPDSLLLPDRQTAVVNKLRERPGINREAIEGLVRTVVGDNVIFNVIDWNCGGDDISGSGVWELGISQLGIDTFLGGARMADVTPFIFPDANFCINDPAFGKTDDEWAAMQEQAYTYEIRIFGYTLTSDQRAQLDKSLSRGEPGRSQHIITDGLDPNDLPSGET